MGARKWDPPTPSYWFGPRESRGLLLGLRLGQLAALICGALLAVLALQALPVPVKPVGAASALGLGLGAAFWPLAGLTVEQWMPVAAGYLWRTLAGRRSWRSRAYLAGFLEEGTPPQRQPWSLRRLEILSVARPVAVTEVGVVKDSSRRAYVGVLPVRGQSFPLLSRIEQAQSVVAWASVLASYGLSQSPIRRLQCVERTIPEDSQDLLRYLAERGAEGVDAETVGSYRSLLELAGPAAQRHESYLAVELDLRRAWRQARDAGQGDLDRGAGMMVATELLDLQERLAAAGLAVEEMLSARQLAGCLRYAFDPPQRTLAAVRQAAGGPEGPHPHNAWPNASEERWACYRSERWWHATYWVSDWPRTEVGPDFLRPLLLGASEWPRTVAVVFEPVPPLKADREVRQARVSNEAEQRLRDRVGQLTRARQEREQEHVRRTDQELADGHVSVRFAGYVTVSAPAGELLARASTELEQRAAQARLVLQRVLGDQELAFTYTLPLCRGLR